MAPDACLSSSNILVKTVRLHHDNVLDWAKERSDVKVVHLVRDPRAMISSMMAQTEEWTVRLASYRNICQQLHMDMEQLENHMPEGRYMRVRYEDIVENPVQEFRKICEFTGVRFDEELERKIEEKVNGNNADPETAKYYSTVRPKGFRHDSWKLKLDKDVVESIQCDCEDVLRKLGYKIKS